VAGARFAVSFQSKEGGKKMKNLVLVFAIALAFCTTAMASDIAFYVGSVNPGWYETPDMLADVDTIITEVGGMFQDVSQFDDDQFDAFGAWVDERMDDGKMDIIWLNGCMPSVLYQFPNVNPDGSRAEEWLDGGNMFINVGDWFGYMSYEGGSRSADNGPSGAANILDLASGIIVSADNTSLTVTPTGQEYLPSLNDPAITYRPIVLGAVQAPWEVAAVFAGNATQADPLVLYNTETEGYIAFINQAAGGPSSWIDDRGLTCAEFIANWVNEVIGLGGGGNPLARRPDPEDGALLEATWGTLSWKPGYYAVSHDVYMGTNFDDVNDGAADTFTGNQASTMLIVGFAGFPFPDGLVPGTTYYWRIDEVNDANAASPWKGDVWSFSIPPKTAYFPDPADGAEFVDPNAVLTWTPGFGAKLHTVYMGTNFDDVNNAAGGVPLGSASYSPGTLESEKVYYWRVDEFDPPSTHKGDVWSFTTPGAVGNPQPANGAVDVQMIATLSWTAADNATSHELYFGTDADAVKNATAASPEYVGAKALGAESYDPGGLAWDSSYAWRVDEVYPAETIKGLVWSFATADFISVDDFEAYNDIDPPDPASNRIFDKWIDGFGTTTNGALVGNDLPPYAEQSIVHGGAQSLVYRYDNNLKTSEATLTLVYPRDWTEEGVTKLSLQLRGSPANSADRIFVAPGNAVVYHPDPAATQLTGWNEWVIDLTEFAGVNLSNVGSITIGIGTRNAPAAGDVGTMYFDDIRLIR